MTQQQKSFQVKANDFVFKFNETTARSLDLVKRASDEYHCLVNHQSTIIRLIAADYGAKTFTLAIDGEIFHIEIKNELDLMLEQMGFGVAANKTISNIKAPMPGLVLEIAAAEGEQLKAGDKVLILEAMKMENSLLLPVDATIRKILVSKGQAVDKGQVLVELE